MSRAGFVGRGLLAGGAVTASGALAIGAPRLAASVSAGGQDARILNAALAIERLQDAFYREALEAGGLTGEIRDFARITGQHEQEHVGFLEELLGARAEEMSPFDLGEAARDADRFASVALTLEESATALYIGQGANLSVPLVADFASIVSVEARQAAWIRDILERNPAPAAADPAKTGDEVRASLARVGIEFSG
jgi:hypothetical protein